MRTKEKEILPAYIYFIYWNFNLKVIPYGYLIEAKDLKLPVNGLLPKKGNQALGTIFFWPRNLQS